MRNRRAADGGKGDLGLLSIVDQLRPGGRAGTRVSPDILDARSQDLLKPRRHEGPRPHILRLFLHPDPLACRLVSLDHRFQLVGRPRIKLARGRTTATSRWLPTSARFATRS